MTPWPHADEVRVLEGVKSEFFKRHKKNRKRAQDAWEGPQEPKQAIQHITLLVCWAVMAHRVDRDVRLPKYDIHLARFVDHGGRLVDRSA